MKQTISFLWEIFKIVILALIIVIPIRYFLFQPFFIHGSSMEPNFHQGDYLIVDEVSYRLRPPQRGEVIVFRYPGNLHERYIKRVIGLPGDKIEIKNGQVIVNDKIIDESAYLPKGIYTPGDIRVSLGKGEYFVLGDNRPVSSDSRQWGLLPKKDIVGKVLVRLWPPRALAKVRTPQYKYIPLGAGN